MFSQISETVQAGGMVMPPLIAACGLLWFGLVHRMQTLSRGKRNLAKLVERDFPPGTPFLSYLARMKDLAAGGKSEKESSPVIFEAREHFAQFRVLTTGIVMLAPLLGLLGTVGGMIETFSELGEMNLFGQTGGIAGGVSQALVSTQMGLAVAIPGLVIGRLLNRKEASLMVELEQAKGLIWSRYA